MFRIWVSDRNIFPPFTQYQEHLFRFQNLTRISQNRYLVAGIAGPKGQSLVEFCSMNQGGSFAIRPPSLNVIKCFATESDSPLGFPSRKESLDNPGNRIKPMTHNLDIQNPGDWLFDTSYLGTCSVCGQRFCGPKRASKCWTHESEELKESWVGSHQEPMNPPMEPSQMVFPFARFPPSDG